MKEKIGILGSGVVARVLGTGFLNKGYDVMLGTRDPGKLEDWRIAGGGKVGTVSEAARFGDLLILAARGTIALSVLRMAGSEALKGKVVMDATNPIADAPPVNGVLAFFTGPNESLMERLQEDFPETKFVKAFNSVGNHLMVDPSFGGVRPTMFICGNDPGAKIRVAAILDLFGWDSEDMGAVEAARAIEPLCMLWCIPGFLRNEWLHAFKLLKANG
ncbi:MAG TPA: NAD(P)-binding domain-containing protein [Bacteroidales bacterium]|nr:NAD(P)-binding domain-containing protein [Bacteroidales bacterium]